MKYNFDLDMVYNNSLSIIAKQIAGGSTVLEFGPANGRLTKYMKEELGCKVYLVEIDEVAGEEAKQYGQELLVDDIENFQWLVQYRTVKFDYIIFADVLEHLRDPLIVLQKAKLLLKEVGTVLISVPNIAHNSVAINLLMNKFEYTDIGLLDSTHIHFFTKESLEKMVREAGFYPSKKMATYNLVGNNEINNTFTDIDGIDESFWKNREYGCVYQYVYELKTGEEYVAEKIDYIVKFYPVYLIMFMFDIGNGFNGDQYVQYAIGDITERKHFCIQVLPSVERIKVVLPGNCIIEDAMACIETDCGSKTELIYESANLDAYEGGQYYFFSNEPELCYRVPHSTGKNQFVLEFKYVTLSRKEMNLIYETMIKVKKQYCHE